MSQAGCKFFAFCSAFCSKKASPGRPYSLSIPPTFSILWKAQEAAYSEFAMPPGPLLERRSARRYKLRLPVIFHWNDGAEHTEGGFTSDVALNGAMILSSRCPPVGADIRIEVLIPSPGHATEEIRVECVGKVTRIEEHTGFGVRGFFNDDHLTRSVLR